MDSFRFCLSETAVPKPRCGTWPRSHQCQAELNNNTRVCCAVLLLLNFRIKRFSLVLAACCRLTGVTVCSKPGSVLTTPLLTPGLLALEATLWFSP